MCKCCHGCIAYRVCPNLYYSVLPPFKVSGNVYLYGSNDGYLFEPVYGAYTHLYSTLRAIYLQHNIFAAETQATLFCLRATVIMCFNSDTMGH